MTELYKLPIGNLVYCIEAVETPDGWTSHIVAVHKPMKVVVAAWDDVLFHSTESIALFSAREQCQEHAPLFRCLADMITKLVQTRASEIRDLVRDAGDVTPALFAAMCDGVDASFGVDAQVLAKGATEQGSLGGPSGGG